MSDQGAPLLIACAMFAAELAREGVMPPLDITVSPDAFERFQREVGGRGLDSSSSPITFTLRLGQVRIHRREPMVALQTKGAR